MVISLLLPPALFRVSYRRGGAPRNLEAEYGYYLMLLNVCVIKVLIGILSQIASEAIWEDVNSKFCMPQTPPSRYAHTLHATIILLPSCPPPTQNPVWNPVIETYQGCKKLITHLVKTGTPQGKPEQAANCWFTTLSWHTAGFVTVDCLSRCNNTLCS